MKLHNNFEWDEDKAQKNFNKHAVTFEDASRALGDDQGDFYHVDKFDPEHSIDENRYVTIASDPDDRRIILVIVWTDRSTDDEQITRIISTRLATTRERKTYAKEIGGR